MPTLVTAGAMLHCTMGSTPSPLAVQAPGRPVAGGQPVATLQDFHPPANVKPFGMCSSSANPTYRGGPSPCVPLITAAWSPASPSVLASGLPVLTAVSQCHCQWGGTVSVISPGQSTVTAS